MNILKAGFDFSRTKNELLLEMRGVSFHNIIDAIAENGILLNVEHPNKKKHPRQYMLVVEYNNYTYCVPYKKTEETIYKKPKKQFI